MLFSNVVVVKTMLIYSKTNFDIFEVVTSIIFQIFELFLNI